MCIAMHQHNTQTQHMYLKTVLYVKRLLAS